MEQAIMPSSAPGPAPDCPVCPATNPMDASDSLWTLTPLQGEVDHLAREFHKRGRIKLVEAICEVCFPSQREALNDMVTHQFHRVELDRRLRSPS